jgi:hypothetical protein
MPCACSTTSRCDEARRLALQHAQAATLEERCQASSAYTHHLYAVGLLTYPTTAVPHHPETWDDATTPEPA